MIVVEIMENKKKLKKEKFRSPKKTEKLDNPEVSFQNGFLTIAIVCIIVV